MCTLADTVGQGARHPSSLSASPVFCDYVQVCDLFLFLIWLYASECASEFLVVPVDLHASTRNPTVRIGRRIFADTQACSVLRANKHECQYPRRCFNMCLAVIANHKSETRARLINVSIGTAALPRAPNGQRPAVQIVDTEAEDGTQHAQRKSRIP